MIFEAFAQGDGTTARIYGGTGLGLSISRELVGLLGGEITVVSSSGKGSTFTIYLPSDRDATSAPTLAPVRTAPGPEPAVTPVAPTFSAVGDRAGSEVDAAPHREQGRDLDYHPFEGTKVLVVDDDSRNIFAIRALLERGHANVVVAESGADALATLEQTTDIDIVLMDIMMPVMDGYEAIRAIRGIERLAALPVIAVTAKTENGERERCIDAGANDYVPKPIDVDVFVDAIVPWLPTGRLAADGGEAGAVQGARILVVVDDDVRSIFAITALLERGRADVTVVESGAEALDVLERSPDFDVVLMDVVMPVIDGYGTTRAIRAIDRFASLPIIAITSECTEDERQRCLEAGVSDYISKPADTIQFLAIVEPWLPKRASLAAPDEALVEHAGSMADRRRQSGREDSPIDGVKILVVDDDIRNIFAMTALLERGRADVTVVESGSEALTVLERTPDFDIVLMDIMMPTMDGYTTIRAIRSIERFKGLVVIAVTGKATAGERQRCLDAGANDYVPKPVDAAELIASLRPWLPTAPGTRSVVAVGGAAEPKGTVGPNRTAEPNRTKRARSAARGLEDSAIDGLKILVVDDDFRNIFAMTALLERSHANVVVAESGADALDVLDRTPDIDLVLMDIMMPIMDGYDTMRAIRAIDRFASLPIVAVTGKAGSGERQRCIDAGANAHVPKPVDNAELLAALKPWLPTTPAQPAA